MEDLIIEKLYNSKPCSTNRSFSRISPREASVQSFVSWMVSEKSMRCLQVLLFFRLLNQPKLFTARHLLNGAFPPQSFLLIHVFLIIFQPHRPTSAGVFGPLTGIVHGHPVLQIRGPAGVQGAVPAPENIYVLRLLLILFHCALLSLFEIAVFGPIPAPPAIFLVILFSFI